MSKIIIIIPYFGKLPFWMPYFLLSCKFNPTINWTIISDEAYQFDIPENVKFINQTYKSYCEKVSEKLCIKFNPSNTYKLCDIKPALGYIHPDLISGYDFWAFGDLDLIYGDLRKYFTESRLSKKSLFSTMATRVSGHLCLIRNQPKLNQAFMLVKDWKLIFEDDMHYAFDEKKFSKVFIKHKNLPEILRSFAKLFNPWLRLGEFVEAYTTPNARIKWMDGTSNFPTTWYWINGRVTNNLNEDVLFPYFHFMVWKKNWINININFLPNNKNVFSIDQNGFY
jgi:hypothetical protein